MTVFGGDVIYAADINCRVGITEATSDTAAAAYTTETTIDTVTVNVVNGQRYRLTAYVPFSMATANDRRLVRIRTGTTSAGVQLTYDTAVGTVAGAVYCVVLVVEWTASSTGAQSFCTTGGPNSGSGNVTFKGASSQIRFLSVDRVP